MINIYSVHDVKVSMEKPLAFIINCALIVYFMIINKIRNVLLCCNKYKKLNVYFRKFVTFRQNCD